MSVVEGWGQPAGPVHDTLGAVVLAGGQARRMGGVDKGLVKLAGQPMVQHVLERLVPQVDALIINANRNAGQYAALGVPVVADREPGFLGPLAGLATALAELPHSLVFMCPCDSPFVAPELVPRLGRALMIDSGGEDGAGRAEIAVAHDGQRMQTAFCLVRREVADSLNEFLAAGDRKIDLWFGRHAVLEVDCRDLEHCFDNINTETEREQAEARLTGTASRTYWPDAAR